MAEKKHNLSGPTLPSYITSPGYCFSIRIPGLLRALHRQFDSVMILFSLSVHCHVCFSFTSTSTSQSKDTIIPRIDMCFRAHPVFIFVIIIIIACVIQTANLSRYTHAFV